MIGHGAVYIGIWQIAAANGCVICGEIIPSKITARGGMRCKVNPLLVVMALAVKRGAAKAVTTNLKLL